MLQVNVVTLFPELFREPIRTSIVGRAAADRLVTFRLEDLREYTTDKHRTVDDYPYGGGAGMVLKPEPFFRVLDQLKTDGPVWLMSARGEPFTHELAVEASLARQITLLCGHYKDVDERVAARQDVREISLGDFVLSGGEFAALCVIDAVVRLLPGALGDHESASTDSHYEGLLSPPSFTRPAAFEGLEVPEVLLSGDHRRIAAWRQEMARQLTRERRPELWKRYVAEQDTEENV